MNTVTTLVDALEELAVTGRLTDDTRAKLSEAVVAERYGHPGFRHGGDDCHYEEIESVPCPICRPRDGAQPG